MALRALLLRERSSSSTRMLPSISIGDGSRPTVSRRYLWACCEVGSVWDVAALFWFAVAFAIGVVGAGGDHAGAGAFLDDAVDHLFLSISVVSAHPLV